MCGVVRERQKAKRRGSMKSFEKDSLARICNSSVNLSNIY